MMRWAYLFALLNAGRTIASSNAIIAITTSNSISVNAFLIYRVLFTFTERLRQGAIATP